MNFFGTVSARLTHLFSELGCNSSSLQRNQEKQPQKPPAYPPVGTPCCVPSALSTAQRALGPREVTSTLPRRSGARSQRCPPRLRPPLRWARSSPEDPRPARPARPRGDARPKPAGGSPQHPGFFGPPVAAEPLGAGGGHSLGTPGSPSRPRGPAPRSGSGPAEGSPAGPGGQREAGPGRGAGGRSPGPVGGAAPRGHGALRAAAATCPRRPLGLGTARPDGASGFSPGSGGARSAGRLPSRSLRTSSGSMVPATSSPPGPAPPPPPASLRGRDPARQEAGAGTPRGGPRVPGGPASTCPEPAPRLPRASPDPPALGAEGPGCSAAKLPPPRIPPGKGATSALSRGAAVRLSASRPEEQRGCAR